MTDKPKSPSTAAAMRAAGFFASVPATVKAKARIIDAEFAPLIEACENMPRPSVQGTIAEFGARILAWQVQLDRALALTKSSPSVGGVQ